MSRARAERGAISRLLDRAERAFVAANRWLLAIILAAMCAIIFANVALRYLAADSLVWAEEIARHLMIGLTFLGSGLALRHGAHIAIENLHDVLPRRAARILRAAIVLALAVFFVAMIRVGVIYVERTMVQMTSATQIPFGYIYAAMPLGFAFMLVHLAFIARGYVSDRRFPESPDLDASAPHSL